ncbi:hypothetical protein J5N97_019507 [Dioscorea zingiberensis]|uniref:Uncharacterized protein n=1 Tax=Dioscorea zingiberensis TaxID=325984 RepID=A0A9D5CE90_9LILI|nr:hypothetical protein J5N97_019507 [Dioscorea zingiberensis]
MLGGDKTSLERQANACIGAKVCFPPQSLAYIKARPAVAVTTSNLPRLPGLKRDRRAFFPQALEGSLENKPLPSQLPLSEEGTLDTSRRALPSARTTAGKLTLCEKEIGNRRGTDLTAILWSGMGTQRDMNLGLMN